jgi:outer membrane protein OmpA-like peptidoglycan-associated protein
MGGSVVYGEKTRQTMLLKKDGKEIWLDISAEFTGKYGLVIVERSVMTQDIVANAAVFADGLRTSGHIAVDGIYFETGKSELKPESQQAIAEIAKLLAGDPALKVYVVGHTDNTGGLEANMRLSQDRAAAVVQSLVSQHGISAARLQAFGAGPYAPVAANDTDEGKAKNRRVELVKQ